jgi:hypothetical protein
MIARIVLKSFYSLLVKILILICLMESVVLLNELLELVRRIIV